MIPSQINTDETGGIEMATASCRELVIAAMLGAVGVTAQAELVGRDLDGNFANGSEAYYDTVLAVTWMRDANYAVTSGYVADGAFTWSAANNWVSGLNAYGITGWRLPKVQPVNGSNFQYFDWADQFSGTRDESYNITSERSELAYMFHVNLGNLSQYDTAGSARPGLSGTDWGLVNRGPFIQLVNDVYWTGVEYEPNMGEAWAFHVYAGAQTSLPKGYPLLAWAVHDGDIGVAVVPEPASAILLLLGMSVHLPCARQRMRSRCR